MAAPEQPVSPLVTLATSYGDGQMRAWCHALFAFDAQMAAIVLQVRDPMLAQIRLQWWHDVIMQPQTARPMANPVLAALSPLENAGLHLPAALCPVIDGWTAALDLTDRQAVQDFAQGRGALLCGFRPLSSDAGDAELKRIGEAWALWDMVRFHRRSALLDDAMQSVDGNALGKVRLPRRLRPLSIIARAVRLDIAQGRMDRPWGGLGVFAGLVWHGLTGR